MCNGLDHLDARIIHGRVDSPLQVILEDNEPTANLRPMKTRFRTLGIDGTKSIFLHAEQKRSPEYNHTILVVRVSAGVILAGLFISPIMGSIPGACSSEVETLCY